MAAKNFRVDIPANPDDLIKLGKKFKDKHVAIADASPIKGVKDTDLFPAKLLVADPKNELIIQLYKDAEKATQDRDLPLGQSGQLREQTVRDWVTAARDGLLGLNKGNEQALGDWGFTVDTSPHPKKPAKAGAVSAGGNNQNAQRPEPSGSRRCFFWPWDVADCRGSAFAHRPRSAAVSQTSRSNGKRLAWWIGRPPSGMPTGCGRCSPHTAALQPCRA